jgi:hypothetical protein
LVVEGDLYVDRMSEAARKSLGQFVRSLDAVTVSQYMPLDLTHNGELPTPQSVRDALLAHEESFFHDVLVGKLGLGLTDIPEFYIGEFGVGIIGLYAPNVWNHMEWSGSNYVLSSDVQKRHTELAMQGLSLYLKDPRTKAQSAMLWLGGNPYDFFNLTAGMPEIYNPGAVKAVVDHLKGL